MIYLNVPFTGCKKESDIPFTREDEMVAFACGLILGGKNPSVDMQNSGLGTCLDVITSLVYPYHIVFPLLVYQGSDTGQHKIMNKMVYGIRRELQNAYEETSCPTNS